MDATDLAFAGAAEQAALIRAGEVSAMDVVQATLDRIEAVDPKVNAFRIVFAERALLEARQSDGRAGADQTRPLLGVPVAVKDDTDVAGEVTARGSGAHGGPATADSEVVRRLREAGAVVVGKTHLPEVGHAPWTESVQFGATRNPWDVTRTAGGSSGGSAAAAASGMCGGAIGSDGAGSIRAPAAWTRLVGLKTTRGRVPLAPYDDAWQGLSVNGPLARTVADVALLMDVIADGGGFSEAAAADPPRLRVAVSTALPPGLIAPIGAEERRAVERTAARLRDLGHEVVERDPEFGLDLWPSAVVRAVRGMHDDASLLPHPERLEPRVRRLAALGRSLPDALVQRARAAEARQAERIGALWNECDVLLTPACAEGPYRIGELHGAGAGRFLLLAPMRIPFFGAFNVTGQPGLSVPAGRDDDGLPVGVQLVGRHGDDATLLALGAQLERAEPWAGERPPQ